LTARTLETLSPAPRLTELNLSHCQWLDDDALAKLERCKTLTKLDISWCRQESLTDAGLASLGRLPSLRVLNMSWCCQNTIGDAGMAALAQSRALEDLDMSHCYQATITDAALEHLSRSATLTRLNLWACEQSFDAAGARALASSRSLRILNIKHMQLSNHAALLGESVSLRELHVSPPGRLVYMEWARAHASLVHAPRLTRVVVLGAPSGDGGTTPDVDVATSVLQTAWDARPAAVCERRAAAIAAGECVGSLTIDLYAAQRCCVLR
jgi:hypothetical protein